MISFKTLTEAENHNGPSIVICYCPCIEHGIKGGMCNSINEEKLAVECGYTLLMRYKDNKLYLIDFGLSYVKNMAEAKAVDLYVL